MDDGCYMEMRACIGEMLEKWEGKFKVNGTEVWIQGVYRKFIGIALVLNGIHQIDRAGRDWMEEVARVMGHSWRWGMKGRWG